MGRGSSQGWTFQVRFFSRGISQNFYLSYFLLGDSILQIEMLMLIVRGEFSPALNCLEDLPVEGKPDFLVLYKKKGSKIK